MRDPVRIKRILNKLEAVWQKYPDLRFGQLYIVVCGVFDETSEGAARTLFNMEDDPFEVQLDAFMVENGITVSGGWKS
jgi:hypothetical protein